MLDHFIEKLKSNLIENKFLFGVTDAKIYSILRMGIGALVVFILISQIESITSNYSEDSWLPPSVAAEFPYRKMWSILFFFTHVPTVKLLFITFTLIALSWTFGYQTRLTGWLTWLWMSSLHQRNWMIITAEDNLLRINLFFLGFSNCNAIWSVDSYIKRRRQHTNLQARVEVPIWPLRMMQIQMVILYASAGLSKLFGSDWLDGSALAISLLHPHLSRYNCVHFLSHPFGKALSILATYLTLFFELSFPLFIFTKHLRRLALAMGIFFHLSILILFEVKYFSFLMLMNYLTFLKIKDSSKSTS